MKYNKPKTPRPTKAMSWSEILAKIQYYVDIHSKDYKSKKKRNKIFR